MIITSLYIRSELIIASLSIDLEELESASICVSIITLVQNDPSHEILSSCHQRLIEPGLNCHQPQQCYHHATKHHNNNHLPLPRGPPRPPRRQRPAPDPLSKPDPQSHKQRPKSSRPRNRPSRRLRRRNRPQLRNHPAHRNRRPESRVREHLPSDPIGQLHGDCRRNMRATISHAGPSVRILRRARRSRFAGCE